MSASYIIPSSPNLLIDRYGLQSAAPANIAMINHLQDTIAAVAPATIIGAHLNHPMGQPPSIGIIAKNQAVPCPAGCDCTIGRDITCFTISNFATGKYMIILSTPAAKGFDVLIAPLSDARQNIGVEVISPTQVIVSTYDIPTAAYVNNAFKNTYIQFQLWN